MANVDLTEFVRASTEMMKTIQTIHTHDASSSSSTGTKIKLCEYVAPSMSGECDLLSANDIAQCQFRYEGHFGRRARPDSDEECSVEQLACLKFLFASSTPYVDFAIWGPHATRSLRKNKMHGWVFTPNGVWEQLPLLGPPSIGIWSSCYKIFMHGCFQLGALSLGLLQSYERKILKLAGRHGTSNWPFIYQCDVRARSERLQYHHTQILVHRIRVDDKTVHDVYDTWGQAFEMMLHDTNWWQYEVKDNLAAIHMGMSQEKFLDGDIETGRGKRQLHGDTVIDLGAGNNDESDDLPRKKKRRNAVPKPVPRPTNTVDKSEKDETTGEFIRNRHGWMLCPE